MKQSNHNKAIQAFRRLTAGVSVISAGNKSNRYAMTASSVTSVSMQPPSLLVCINQDADIVDDTVPNPGNEDSSDKQLTIDIPPYGSILGMKFDNKNIAVESILAWSTIVFCPLVKLRRSPGFSETNGEKRGRMCFECPHGKTRPGKSTVLWPIQNVKFNQCSAFA